MDGNKRTAWTAAAVFLAINGRALREQLDEDAAESLVLDTAQSLITVREIADRLAPFFT